MNEVFGREWRISSNVRQITKQDAEPMVKAHYLGRHPGVTVLRLGAERDGVLFGCIIYALPPRETSKRYGGPAWELARLWVADEIPKNAETWLIGQSVKWIKRNRPEIHHLVSYADPSVGHAGVIYKAANWRPDGRTDDDRKTPRFDYIHPQTGKHFSRRAHVPDGVVPLRKPRVSKHRFHLPLATT